MIINFIGLGLVVLLGAAFAFLFFRASRFNRRTFRLGGRVIGGMGALGFLVLAAFIARGFYILYAPQRTANIEIPVTAMAGSSDQVARGEHIASSLCASCHTLTGELPLSGGINMSDDVKMPLGDLFAPNLTQASVAQDFTDTDFWRLFRHGILPDGRRAVMPIWAMKNLSDEDLAAVVAYLRSQSAVDYQTKPINPSILAAVAIGSGMMPLATEPIVGPVTAPERGATVEYGKYVVSFMDCVGCHGQNLDGKVPPPLPPGPNLRVVKGWTSEQFITTIRTGVNPGGHELQPPMPWKVIRNLDDTELTAIWAYLQSLE